MTKEKKVLIVDDNESLLMALEYNIQLAGYTVLKATDGEMAFGIAESENPDIIVSDITMPEMDGIELCKKIRSVARLSETPFILLTALGEPDERVKGLRSGADDYIVKPFDIEELIARIDIMYKNSQKRQFSNTLSGNIKELPVIDILQILAQSRKEGVLKVKAGEKSGMISLRDGSLMDASFMDLEGEDALVELFSLCDGHYYYEPQDITSGTFEKPVNYVILDLLRMIDERAELCAHIPDFESVLVATGSADGKSETDELFKTVTDGVATTGLEIQKNTGLSRINIELRLAKLVHDGLLQIKPPEDPAKALQLNTKPMRILLAFVDESSAKLFLEKTASAFNVPNTRGIKSGVADFLKIVVSNVSLQIFSLKGEKKFSFLWEPMLITSNAVIFVTSSAEENQHVDYLKQKLPVAKKIPFFAVSSSDNPAPVGVEQLNSREKITTFFQNLLKSHCL